uniref:7TM_GPCR_Srx domain-containing protein n=1 Tax=Rhabditophanes sp. KR3021 TaxID=114890 RepID=A0AC35TFN0_9BILA
MSGKISFSDDSSSLYDEDDALKTRRTERQKPHFDLYYFGTKIGILRTIEFGLCLATAFLIGTVSDMFILTYVVEYSAVVTALFVFELLGIGVGLAFTFNSIFIMLYSSYRWNHFAWWCSMIHVLRKVHTTIKNIVHSFLLLL